jgi:repressor LexA
MQQFEAQEIGARIKQARLERGLTQEQLAEMASFSKRSLQDYEAGSTIPYSHFRELGRLLNKPPEWFLYGDEAGTGDQLAEIIERLERIEGKLSR